MNNTVNGNTNAYWNGEGANKWLRIQDRMDSYLIPFGDEAMKAGAISTGERVLDIGCGCGDAAFEIGRRVGGNGHVHGLDISNPFLDEARKRKAAAAVGNVTFEYGDAQIYPFEAGLFDMVFSRFGVMFFDDPVQAFGNMRRAIRGGGRLAFICWQPARENEWISFPLDIIAKHLVLPDPPGPEDPGPLAFGDANRISNILVDAGFSDIRIKGFETPFTIGANVEEAIDFLIRLGPPGGPAYQAGVDDAALSHIVSDLAAALSCRQSRGGVKMGAATWIVTAIN